MRCIPAGLALASLLAVVGCRTTDPLPFAQTMAGSHDALAKYFADTHGDARFVVSDAQADRTISVDVNADGPAAYRVTFAPLAAATRVSLSRPGTTPPAFFWHDEVLPRLARCAGQTRG